MPSSGRQGKGHQAPHLCREATSGFQPQPKLGVTAAGATCPEIQRLWDTLTRSTPEALPAAETSPSPQIAPSVTPGAPLESRAGSPAVPQPDAKNGRQGASEGIHGHPIGEAWRDGVGKSAGST